MKRPNVKRMVKHRAKSTPDRVTATFDQSSALYFDEMPEVQMFIRKFTETMRIKHGHEPIIETFTSQDWMQPFPGVFTLELVYKGAREPFDFIAMIQSEWAREMLTPKEARSRFW